MDTTHRKVELQSPSDLDYLTRRIRTAARHKLDLHLPPVSDTSEPDELRQHVESLVDAFVAQVLAGMRKNISINGNDVVMRSEEGDMSGVEQQGKEVIEDFEPFDEKLRGKLGTAVQKRDVLVAKISQHRRMTGQQAAKAFEEQFERESEALLKAHEEAFEKASGEVRDEDMAGVNGIQRREEVEKNWERAVERLAKLDKGLPETRARLERCGDVVGYLDSKK